MKINFMLFHYTSTSLHDSPVQSLKIEDSLNQGTVHGNYVLYTNRIGPIDTKGYV